MANLLAAESKQQRKGSDELFIYCVELIVPSRYFSAEDGKGCKSPAAVEAPEDNNNVSRANSGFLCFYQCDVEKENPRAEKARQQREERIAPAKATAASG